MFDMGCMVGTCLLGFLQSRDGLMVTLGALFLAVVALLQLKRSDLSVRKKTAWIYTTFFSVLFPLVYFTLSVPCAGMLACQAKAFFKALPIALLGSIVLGYLVSPLLYRRMLKARELGDGEIAGMVSLYSSRLGMRQPKVLLVDDQKPVAFSTAGLQPTIFVSVGLLELLTKKEAEAVLLHELSHLKNSNQLFKFSSLLVKRLVPVFSFNEIRADLENEELKADRFAVQVQGTGRHLASAKKKFDAFHSFDRETRCGFS